MKYKVIDLSGALLDAAVAKAEGVEIEQSFARVWRKPVPGVARETYEPSSDWAIGGPIIQREQIVVIPYLIDWDAATGKHARDGFRALVDYGVDNDYNVVGEFHADGATYLIAAMRAYATSVFGEYVEL